MAKINYEYAIAKRCMICGEATRNKYETICEGCKDAILFSKQLMNTTTEYIERIK